VIASLKSSVVDGLESFVFGILFVTRSEVGGAKKGRQSYLSHSNFDDLRYVVGNGDRATCSLRTCQRSRNDGVRCPLWS
jgi:hypothetical protein